MEVYKTEEEQLEQLKGWLRENGRSIVFGIVVAVAVVFGWRGWQAQQRTQAELASVQFQSLLQSARQLELVPQPSAEQLTTANTLADGIKRDFPKSTYAQLAVLLKAQLAVAGGDLTLAEQELNWVLQQKPEAGIEALARLRLARVLHAAGNNDEALAQLHDGGSYAYAYEQARGDILQAKGDLDGARAAYQRSKALAAALKEPLSDPLLEVKLRDLGVEPAAPETTAEKSE